METANRPPLDDRTLWTSLHGSVRRHVRDQHEAEDIVQDALVEALQRPPKNERALGAWLRTVTRHLAGRRIAARHARRTREERAAQTEALPSLESEFETRWLREDLEREVERLPSPYGEVVRLRYFEDLETEDVAAILGRTPGTVRVQLKRGLDRIRRNASVDARRRWGFPAMFGPIALWHALRRRSVFTLAHPLPILALIAAGTWTFLATRSEPAEHTLELPAVAAAERPSERSAVAPPETRTEFVAITPVGAKEPLLSRARAAWSGERNVHGVVTSPAGPVPFAEIIETTIDPHDLGRVIATADEYGEFELESVRENAWLAARRPEGVASTRHLVGSFPGGRFEPWIGPDHGDLVGQVVGADGIGVAGAIVRVENGRIVQLPYIDAQPTWTLSQPPTETVTDAEGRFSLPRRDILVAEHLVVTTPEGGGLVAAIPAHEATEEVILQLAPEARILGTVTTPSLGPVNGRTLHLELPAPYPTRSTRSDENGLFDFGAVPPGPYRLWVEATRAEPDSYLQEGTVEPGEVLTANLETSDAFTVSGTLAWPEGTENKSRAPRGRIKVRSPPEPSPIVAKAGSTARLPILERVAELDPSGRFLVAGLPQDTPLVLLAEGEDGSWVVRRDEVMAGGEEPHLTSGPGEFAEFIVRFHGPTELLPRWVEARNKATGASYRFDVAGASTLRSGPLPPGQLDLRLWVEGLGFMGGGRINLEPGERFEIDSLLREPGRLRMAVELPPGVHSSDLQAILVAVGCHAMLRDTFDDRPVVYERTLVPGPYRMLLRGPGIAEQLVSFGIEDGSVSDITVRLKAGAKSVIALVSDPPLEPDETVVLVVEDANGQREPDIGKPEVIEPGVVHIGAVLQKGAQRLSVYTSLGRKGEWSLGAGEAVPEHFKIHLR